MDKDENAPSTVAEAATRDPKDTRIEELEAEVAKLKGNGEVIRAFDGEAPLYLINDPKGVFLEDDTLHEEGELVEYTGCPNLAMVPQNEPARKRMKQYVDELTEGARQTAAINGRPFRRLELDQATVLATALQDARRDAGNHSLGNLPTIEVPTARGKIPQMPHTDEARAAGRKQGGPKRGQMVVSAKKPAPPGKASPQPVNVIGRDQGMRTSGT